MKLTSLPKKTAGELFIFMAEQESFESTLAKLRGEVTEIEIRSLLREVGMHLMRGVETDQALNSKSLGKRSKEVLSCLSPMEEEKVLSAFGLHDDE